jgi:hypothetical protein
MLAHLSYIDAAVTLWRWLQLGMGMARGLQMGINNLVAIWRGIRTLTYRNMGRDMACP